MSVRNKVNKLLAGTKYRTSVAGHNNFVYPSPIQDTLISDADVTTMHFVGGGSLTAVTISEHALKHDGDVEKRVIIWVDKDEITWSSKDIWSKENKIL